MNLFIYNDSNHKPIGLLLSDSLEKVKIALSGMNIQYNTIEEIDPNLDIGINGLAFILTSTEKECLGRVGKKYRQWKRGR